MVFSLAGWPTSGLDWMNRVIGGASSQEASSGRPSMTMDPEAHPRREMGGLRVAGRIDRPLRLGRHPARALCDRLLGPEIRLGPEQTQ